MRLACLQRCGPALRSARATAAVYGHEARSSVGVCIPAFQPGDSAGSRRSGSERIEHEDERLAAHAVDCAALLVLFFTAIGFTVSLFKNRAMVNNAVAAAEAIPVRRSGGYRACLQLDSLQKLETLRQALEQLTSISHRRPSVQHGLGLVRG